MKASESCVPDRDGFRGYFYEPPRECHRCMLVLIGDDGNDFMDRACARWLTEHESCSALCIGLRQNAKEDPGISLWPLETVQSAVRWLRSRGICKIGILGMSMQAALALSAAARIPEISLVIALSPCDFVPWGFAHGPVGKSRNAEYPTGRSTMTWGGSPLPWQKAGLSKEDYWALYSGDSSRLREPHSRGVFDRSEALCPVPEEAKIPAEQIRGAVVLVGAEDDSMWNSTRYINRLRTRLKEKGFPFPVKSCTYVYGTHLLVPQRMLMEALPVLGGCTALAFRSGRKHRSQCRRARQDLDRQLSDFLLQW